MKLDRIDTQPRHDISRASLLWIMQGTSATLNSDHAAFSVYALKSEHGEREREPWNEWPVVSLPFMIDGKANVGKHNSSANDKNFASETIISPWYDWPPFFFHLNFPLLFERIRISMMRRKKWTTNIFARPFSSFSPDPRVPAIGISRGLVGKISRDFQQMRRIISFQILPNVHRDIWIFKFL